MMIENRVLVVLALGLTLACGGSEAAPGAGAGRADAQGTESAAPADGARGSAAVSQVARGRTWSFDDVPSGGQPTGWRFEQTNPRGEGAAWSVLREATAPSGGQVLALTDPRGARGSTYNVAWTDEDPFQDGRIEVKLEAREGREDQGGGPIWRVQDRDNYYVARWNPLEDNFRLYYVQDGDRRQLESADADLAADQWHTIAIEQRGDRITAFLDGREMFETTDDTFTGAGGIGVWTKADAATSFDDLSVSGEAAP